MAESDPQHRILTFVWVFFGEFNMKLYICFFILFIQLTARCYPQSLEC